jgi:uncharacterized protein (TIGR02231 family)
VSTESRAVSITFFEDRARVTRVAEAAVSRGVHTVQIAGVSALIDETSLVVRSSVGEIKAAQVLRYLERDDDGSTRRQALEAEVELTTKHRDHAAHGTRRAELALEAALQLEAEFVDRLGDLSSGLGRDITTCQKALGQLGDDAAARRRELHEAREALEAAEERLARAAARLAQARAEEPRMRARVEVQVEVEQEAKAELRLTYFVPCALWRPQHRARLLAGDDTAVEFTTLATVWQQTGEVWEGLEASFSTARLSRPSRAPRLEDDVLRAQPRVDRKTIEAEFRDQLIDELDEGRARAVDEMPGIDDGGRPLVFRASRPLTLASDGEPVQVECSRVQLPADTEQVLYAELTDGPHLVARGLWKADHPLLAGPMALIRGSEFAGRTRQDFVAVGDAWRVGFGPNQAVRAQRRVDEERKTSKLTGRQTVSREVHVFLSNLSGEAQRFELVERVPVSELDELTITVDEHRPDRDGFIRLPITLKPRETRRLSLRYRIDTRASVALAT